MPVALRSTSDVAGGRKRRDVEARRLTCYHRGHGIACRGSRGKADMLVAEGKPQARMPWRAPDHRQTIRQRRPRATPGLADGLAEFDDAARHWHHQVELGER